ncbi:MAG TPA: four-carbon acid sugar kinase family protein [Sedimentibacter sp.]|nr:four-carbon acid sugar kinase family protein [Sedimentibacter sp.]
MNENLLSGIYKNNEEMNVNFDEQGKKIVVLDDDPTGTQTVYDLPIYTRVDYEIIQKIFQDNNIKAFYILTNTRSMSKEKVMELDSKIARNIDLVSKRTGIDYELIVRGDSTLRGHFPLELNIIKDNISKKIDGYFLIPFFQEGGRITVDDVHYVKENNTFIPVGETQFARDHTFGFTSSNLKDYVEEKTNCLVLKDQVVSISLEELRSNSSAVFNKIMDLNGRICIVNAENYSDIQAFVNGLIKAEYQGKNFLFRTAASFVKSRIGLKDNGLLDGNTLNIIDNRGGLIVAGSYVNKTSQQINHLMKETSIYSIEIDVLSILTESDNSNIIKKISQKIDENIIRGIDTLIYTSRSVILGNDNTPNLDIGNKISLYLAKIVKQLKEAPAFIVAKGGITSSDIATEGLNIEEAIVCGQIANGVPVWKSGRESKFYGLVYVVFPGNVGDEDELTNVIRRLHKK